MKKTLYFEAPTVEEQREHDKKWLQKSLDYGRRVNWEGHINDILELAEKKGIDLNN